MERKTRQKRKVIEEMGSSPSGTGKLGSLCGNEGLRPLASYFDYGHLGCGRWSQHSLLCVTSICGAPSVFQAGTKRVGASPALVGYLGEGNKETVNQMASFNPAFIILYVIYFLL